MEQSSILCSNGESYFQNILQEYEAALKKSNTNVECLKERICELLEEKKELKSKLSQYTQENKENFNLDLSRKVYSLTQELTEKDKLIEEKNIIISSLNKALSVTNYNKNPLITQNDNLILKEKNFEFEKMKKNEKTYIDTIEQLKQKLKKAKEELKTELSEKIELLRKLEKAENRDLFITQKEPSKTVEYKYIEDDEMKKKIEELEKELQSTKTSLSDTLIEMNCWKYVISEISKYRIKECEHYIIDNITQVNSDDIQKAPEGLMKKIENVIKTIEGIYDNEISSLASDFKTEIILRRKIHHRYMSYRGNLRVMCRVRPLLFSENTSSNRKALKESINTFDDTITLTSMRKKTEYEFDYVFNQRANQQEIYDEVSMLINNITHEKNVCIISYGQTNSGKSYTIEGNDKYPGIVPRAIKEIFKIARENKEKKFSVSMSVIEIYNDVIYNLLEESTPVIEMYEDNNVVSTPELNPVKIKTEEEGKNLLKLATKLRITRQNLYNEKSSRSHCIFTINIKFMKGGDVKRAKVNFVDLAGSERLSKSNVMDEILKKESQYINLSLNSLANVLNAIAQKKVHVPYRDCKLTHYLKESLTYNFNILLILHVSPKVEDINESFCTLDFGSRFCKLCKYKTGEEKKLKRSRSIR